ncbi:MAG TPA: GNAT family N-acetyltransferase [Acidimicrobiales bacterium]|nr:GNAT family N-acetyltransferase [Acidimicrobiales bacterium]
MTTLLRVAAQLRVRRATRADWARAFEGDPGAVVTQSAAWRDAVLAEGRHRDTSLLYELPSGRRVLLPLLEPRYLARGTAIASWPRRHGVGGPLGDVEGIDAEEAAAVLTDVVGRGRLIVSLRFRPGADDAWVEAAAGRFRLERNEGWVLDLDGGFDEVWKHRFRDDQRKGMRKAERRGAEVERDRGPEGLAVFYDLYKRSMLRWATERNQPLWVTRARMRSRNYTTPQQLERVARHFGPDCSAWIARVEGRPVAAAIVLSAGPAAKGWRRAMDRELAAPVRANDLIDRAAIESACREGRRFFDVGAAEPGSSLARTKQRLGATPHPMHVAVAAPPLVQAARARAHSFLESLGGEG